MQDRYSITTISKPVSDFVHNLFNSLVNKLKLHDFIARQQSNYLKEKKSSLLHGEYILIMDFSENYSMVTQNEIQAAHFSKVQATIHPIVAYYKTQNENLECLSWVAISDHLKHDTVAVNKFQSKFIDFIKTNAAKYPKIRKIYYFTDGCAAQYKN